MERLLQLEQDIECLRSLLALPQPQGDSPSTQSERSIWPGDELLLTRLLRRSPIALSAYQGAAELTTEKRGLRLTSTEDNSLFHFCELLSGDAVVWIQPNPPAWIWRSPTVMLLFHIPPGLDDNPNLLPQTLPLFKPVVRRQLWTLARQGELVTRDRPSHEQSEQVNQLRRLESLERNVLQLITRQNTEMSEMRKHLSTLEVLLNRLWLLSGQDR
jgi:hypothetical protein